jgi:hypothetical protein
MDKFLNIGQTDEIPILFAADSLIADFVGIDPICPSRYEPVISINIMLVTGGHQ